MKKEEGVAKGVHPGWRVAAIVLGIMLLLASGLFAYGTQLYALETSCSNYCYDKQYESFSYDYQTNLCSCYVGTDIKEIVPMD